MKIDVFYFNFSLDISIFCKDDNTTHICGYPPKSVLIIWARKPTRLGVSFTEIKTQGRRLVSRC